MRGKFEILKRPGALLLSLFLIVTLATSFMTADVNAQPWAGERISAEAGEPITPQTLGTAVNIVSSVPALTVNSSVVSFAGTDWWVIGNPTTGVTAGGVANTVTLLHKTYAAAAPDGYGTTPFRQVGGNSSEPSDPPIYGNTWEKWAANQQGGTIGTADGYYYKGDYYINPNEYKDSTLMGTMGAILAGFDATEAGYITDRIFKEVGVTTGSVEVLISALSTAAIANQKLWPLSYAEYNTVSGGTSGSSVVSYDNQAYWLRAASLQFGNYAYRYGSSLDSTDVKSDDKAARPAFLLDLSKVLFTSVASAKSQATLGSPSAVTTSGDTSPVKFTMEDTNRDTFQVTGGESGVTIVSGYPDRRLQFSYTGAKTNADIGGNGNRVSCVFKSKTTGAVEYYVYLADTSTVSSGAVDISVADIPAGDYTLEIFSEQVNGGKYTDFASAPVSTSVTLVTVEPLTLPAITGLMPNESVIGFAGQQWWVVGKNIAGEEAAVGINSGNANTLTLLLSDQGETFNASTPGGVYGTSPFRTGQNTSAAGFSEFTYSSGDKFYYASNPTAIGDINDITDWAKPNEYLGSTLHQKMYELYATTGGFALKEKTKIITRTLPTTTGITDDNTYALTKVVPNQYLWPLSYGEVSSYISGSAVDTFGGSGHYWLRSPNSSVEDGAHAHQAWVGDGDGGLPVNPSVALTDYGVRPAFTLGLSSVMFTSVASGAGMKSDFALQTPGDISTWSVPATPKKFTFSDALNLTLTLSGLSTDTKTVSNASDASLYLGNYTATAGNTISALFVNQGTGPDYYVKLLESSAANGTLGISTGGIAAGTYTLNVFTEQINGPNQSDFCSVPETLNVTVKSSATDLISVAEHTGLTFGGGNGQTTATAITTAAINVQNSKTTIGSLDIVVTTGAVATLYNSADFAGEGETSITLTEGEQTDLYIKVVAEDDTTTRYYKVTVNRPLRDAPSGLTTESPSIIGKNDGKIINTTDAMEYKLSSAGIETYQTCSAITTGGLEPGDYNVRYKETDQNLASAVATVAINASGVAPSRILTVSPVAFAAATYGAITPSALAQTITVSNSGNWDATIESVTVSAVDGSSPTFDFDIITSDAITVPAKSGATDGTNTSWQIKPKANLNAGTHSAIITVTYDGTSGNTTATAAAIFHVNKANPNYTTPAGLSITYAPGLTLGAISLTSYAGFTWESPNTLVGDATTAAIFKATFTPSDTANYNVITGIDVSVAVHKATPVAGVDYTTPTGLTASVGQTLGAITSAQLNTPAATIGAFSWDETSSGGAPASINLTPRNPNATYYVQFTPQGDNATNYNEVTGIAVTVAVQAVDAELITVAGFAVATSGSIGDGKTTATAITTAAIDVPNAKDVINLADDIVVSPYATVELCTTAAFETTVSSIDLTAGAATHLYIKVTAENGDALYYDVTVNRPYPTVTFAAVQVGGASETANTTGIAITFSAGVTGLTADKITITNATGAAIKSSVTDALTGSGIAWTIALSDVITPGSINIAITGDNTAAFPFIVDNANSTQTVEVYQQATRVLTVSPVAFTAATYGAISPTALKKTITITNSGNRIATITDVTIAAIGDSPVGFDIITSDAITVPAKSGETNGTNTSWQIQPKTTLNAGTHSAIITVTYGDAATATAAAIFRVNKANPNYTAPTGLSITYAPGLTLGAVVLSQEDWPGFAWDEIVNDPDTTPLGAATTAAIFKAKFTPSNTDTYPGGTANYNVITGIDVSVAVDKAIPAYEAYLPSLLYAIVGRTLDSITSERLNGNNSAAPERPDRGTFSWDEAENDPEITTVSALGVNPFKVKFTPADETNYTTVGNISVTVTGLFAPMITNADTNLTAAVAGASYTNRNALTANGTPPITWNIMEGADIYTNLPADIAFDESNGEFSGTPTVAGTYHLTVSAINCVGDSDTKQFTLTVYADSDGDGIPDINDADSDGYTGDDDDDGDGIRNNDDPDSDNYSVSGGGGYGIGFSVKVIDFSRLTAGYTVPPAQTVLIENKSETTITNLNATIVGANASAFRIVSEPTPSSSARLSVLALSQDSLAPGKTARVSVQPVANLSANPEAYTANLKITTDELTASVPIALTVLADSNGDGIPDVNDINSPAFNETGGGGADDDSDGTLNINDPDSDCYYMPGGGGADDDKDGTLNINDPDSDCYYLPGGGGSDDDRDGILNINDPDSPCYYLPGGGGSTKKIGKTNSIGKANDTGDDTLLWPWFAALIPSLILAVWLIVRRRRITKK